MRVGSPQRPSAAEPQPKYKQRRFTTKVPARSKKNKYLNPSCPSCAPLKIGGWGWKDATPKGVTPECFNRGSSSDFPWIPAKSMRE